MIGFLADENFDSRIVNGIRRRDSSMDIVRVQDVGLRTKGDDEVLEWAAVNRRVVLTHDVSTMADEANFRISNGLAMAGLIIVQRGLRIAVAIEEILVISSCAGPDGLDGQVEYVPVA